MPPPNKNILIVDDAEFIVERITEMVGDIPGIGSVTTAQSYDAAVHFIREHKPDIVLLDINLPGKSGIEVLKDCRNDIPAAAIVMITNQGNPYYKKQCMQLGADYFIDKTKEFETIASVVSGILRGRH
jgi:DNA-binding NarL/FixJ family response regulator